MFHIIHHTDDLARDLLVSDHKSFTHHVLIWPEAASHRFVDNYHWQSVITIRFREQSTLLELYSHHREIIGNYHLKGGGKPCLLPFGFAQSPYAPAPAKRKAFYPANRFYTGQS